MLPISLLSFSHHINRLRDLVLEFKECASTEETLRKMLIKLKITKKAHDLMVKDPIRFIYSPLVALIASVDAHMQVYLCTILAKLRCTDDHTNTVNKLTDHFKLSETTCILLSKVKEDLELSPEELLEILDAA